MDEELNITSIAKDLVQYAIISKEQPKDELNLQELSELQEKYIQGVMNGLASGEMCRTLGLSYIQPYLWKKQNKMFLEAMDLIKNIKADSLEERMWNEAIDSEKPNIIAQMFLLKEAKPSYRENATPQGSNSVNIIVSIGDKEFKVVTDCDNLQD